MFDNWKKDHYAIVFDYIHYINSCSNGYRVLGDTAKMMFGGLSNFTQNVELESTETDIFTLTDMYCRGRGFIFKVIKDKPNEKICSISCAKRHTIKVSVKVNRATLRAVK